MKQGQRPTFRQQLLLLLSIICLTLLVFRPEIFLESAPSPYKLKPNLNQLALGDAAQSGEPISITINPPQEFDGLSKVEVFARRKTMVMKHSELLASSYTPDDFSFGQIVSGLPWWGLRGEFRFVLGLRESIGETSPLGLSEETISFLNPFALFVPFCGINRSIKPTVEAYERSASVDESRLYCNMTKLEWNPQQSLASLEVDFTSYWETVRSLGVKVLPLDSKGVGFLNFQTYNAQDLGFRYFRFEPSQSRGISQSRWSSQEKRWKQVQWKSPVRMRQFIHQGGSCQHVPSGCNNRSPRTPMADDYWIDELPAKVSFHLWREKPQTTASPGMRFEITIR